MGFLAQKSPKVARRLSDNQIDLVTICSEWHITWFAKVLPVSTVMRVWDTLFLEGFKVLFRVSLSVFKIAEPEILKCTNFEMLMQQAKWWPRTQVEHNELLKTSFKHSGSPLRRGDLLKARDDELRQIRNE